MGWDAFENCYAHKNCGDCPNYNPPHNRACDSWDNFCALLVSLDLMRYISDPRNY